MKFKMNHYYFKYMLAMIANSIISMLTIVAQYEYNIEQVKSSS